VELKGIAGALQMIAYRCPSGRTALQCIMLQSHFYGLNIMGYGMQSRFITLFQALYAKIIEKKKMFV
jgi:hypothetical protein